MFIKMSLLFLYLRLSPDQIFRTLVYIMIFVSAGFGIGSVCSAALQCRPISKLWIPDTPGSCIHVITFYYANAVINIVTDIIIYALPIRILWALQLPKRQRLGLVLLFSLGGLVVVASLIRLATLKALINSTDPTWSLVSPYNWSTIEIHVGIFITCGPAFKAFVRRYLPRLLGNSSYGRSTGGGRHYLDPRHPHYGSYPLSSAKRTGDHGTLSVGATTKTVISAVARGKQSETESEENIILSYQGIIRETTVNVEVGEVGGDDAEKGSGYSASAEVEPGTAK
jgi:hypothetical protein